MIWRWYRDWREQRAVMRELGQVRGEEERLLAAELGNPFVMARHAARAGSLVEAAVKWNEAKVRLPRLVYKSHESVEILCAIGRLDEAETHVREAMRRFPSDRFFREAFADIAQRRGDLEVALDRWQQIRYG